MWITPEGPETLQGAFAQLVRCAIAEMIDAIGEDDDVAADYETGVSMFDALGRSARLALLARVGSALLRDETPPPTKRAVNDATVAAIFAEVTPHLFDENVAYADRWRRLVVEALDHTRAEVVPTLRSQLPETWVDAVEGLRDNILEDSDYLLEHTTDRPPDVSRKFKEIADIPEDYFAEPAPEPSDEELKQILADLCELAGTIEGDYLPIWMYDDADVVTKPDRTVDVELGTWVEYVLGDRVLQGRIIAGTSQLAVFRLEQTTALVHKGRRRKQYKEWRQGEHVSAAWSSLRVQPKPLETMLDKLPHTTFAADKSGQYFAVVDTVTRTTVAMFTRQSEAKDWAKRVGSDHKVVTVAA